MVLQILYPMPKRVKNKFSTHFNLRSTCSYCIFNNLLYSKLILIFNFFFNLRIWQKKITRKEKTSFDRIMWYLKETSES